MFVHQGIYLPDGEKHFPEWMANNGELVDGRGSYQIRKWRACLPWIRNWRTAVDCGAHVGFWSIQMANRFDVLHAFEPMSVFRECWTRNVVGTEARTVGSVIFERSVGGGIGGGEPKRQVTYLHGYALGSSERRVRMDYNPADSGNTHVAGEGDIEMRSLDSFALENVDYLKIDCEGFEHNVIEGARETIMRCRPCVIVEQKQKKMAQNYPGLKGTPAVDMLLAMGAKQRAILSGDHILSWD